MTGNPGTGNPGTGNPGTENPGTGGRRALVLTMVLLIAAAAVLGAAAVVGWARVGFLVPLRGPVSMRVSGADLIPALSPLALLAVAAVAAVLGTGGWARRLLGLLMVLAAVPPVVGVFRVAEPERVTAVAAATLPARSVPEPTVAVQAVGPVLAAVGTALLAGAGVVLVLRGPGMPRMGGRYRTPRARSSAPQDREPGERQLWERMDAGEDPTVPDDPR